jgi:hypothetical protein
MAALFVAFACADKLDLQRIGTNLPLFQTYWFESEKTLFVFYHVATTQRVKNQADVEYKVDDSSWISVANAPLVQKHHLVNCGDDQRCGSISIKSDQEPKNVGIRLRFSKGGDLADSFETVPRVIATLSGTEDRSFYVYGVFDKTNKYIQWRGRNNFPGLTHQEANFYGIDRPFSVRDLNGHNDSTKVSTVAPSQYGIPNPCTGTSISSLLAESQAGEDIWHPAAIADEFPESCITARSIDAIGDVNYSALARKNPEVSPIKQDLTLRFTAAHLIPLIFASCKDQNPEYLEFQKSRLQMQDHDIDICTEDAAFSTESIRQLLLTKIKEARTASNKSLALTIILHYINEQSASTIEATVAEALALVLNDSLNPYVAATFVYDSYAKTAVPVAPKPAVIWCPTLNVATQTINSCHFAPAKLVLGPLEIRASPLLPDYPSFLELDEQQKNGIKVNALRVLTPSEPSSEGKLDIVESEVGYWIFHPDDKINLKGDEFLSYCQKSDPTVSLAYRMLSESNGGTKSSPSLMQRLPEEHNTDPSDQVAQVGLLSPFPFYLTIEYKNTVALGPKGLTGVLTLSKQKLPLNEELGARILGESRIPMDSVLSRCTRYCQHPAFDDTGTYLLGSTWIREFQTRCYEPSIPVFGGAP